MAPCRIVVGVFAMRAGKATRRIVRLMQDQQTAAGMGAVGRESVLRRWSLEQTVRGYENLIATTYRQKRASRCRQSSVWRCGISPQRPTA